MLKKIFFRILDLFKKYWHKIWGEKMAVKVNRLKKKQNIPQPPILMRSVWSTRDAGPPRRQINLVVKQDGRVGMIDENLEDLESGYDGFVELSEPLNLGNKGDYNVTQISFNVEDIIKNMITEDSRVPIEKPSDTIDEEEELKLEKERFYRLYRETLWNFKQELNQNTENDENNIGKDFSNPQPVGITNSNYELGGITEEKIQKNTHDKMTFCPGEYQLIYTLADQNQTTGHVEEMEHFVSSMFPATVHDNELPDHFLNLNIKYHYHKQYVVDRDPDISDNVLDILFSGYVHKPAIKINLNQNKNVVVNAQLVTNKKDRYTTYFEIKADGAEGNFSNELNRFFLLTDSPEPDDRAAYEFVKVDEGIYRSWIPEWLTATADIHNLWIVGVTADEEKDGENDWPSKQFVSEKIVFQAKDNFLEDTWVSNNSSTMTIYTVWPEDQTLEISLETDLANKDTPWQILGGTLQTTATMSEADLTYNSKEKTLSVLYGRTKSESYQE